MVNFVANDPNYLLEAAKLVEDKCDAVDLNLGCPQGIAKKVENMELPLMDYWDLVHVTPNSSDNLKCPVTAKIRVYDDWEKSLAYAKMVLGCRGFSSLPFMAVIRDMKGQATGLANWKNKHWLDNLPEGSSFLCKWEYLYPSDLQRCREEWEPMP